MTIRKIALALALAALVALAIPGVALANFGPHGNYILDTDACAGCHRAHTSVSSITWGNNQGSALLVTSASQLWQFCYACHDGASQGADTNVQDGVYEGTLYGTQGDPLNSGGFEYVGADLPVTSTHVYQGSSWGAYGGGYFGQGISGADGQIPGAQIGESEQIKMDCGSCHDPHGSANYRLLRASVNGNVVGGYTPAEDPRPWVRSVEPGFPADGFRLRTAYPAYQPSYTEPMYAKGYDPADSTTIDSATGMSGWCSGCHSTYMGSGVYNAGDGHGLATRHRHPMNVELDNYSATYAGTPLAVGSLADNGLPIAHDLGTANDDELSDWIECLTCHRAHGTAAVMEGFAERGVLEDPVTGLSTGSYRVVDIDGTARNIFVASDSALLRRDNRGVCEGCHNK